MSYIYVIGTDTEQKIGYTKDTNVRLSTLQTGNSSKLKLHHLVEINDDVVRKVEKTIHREYSYLRIRGEWFKMSPDQAKECIIHAKIRWEDEV